MPRRYRLGKRATHVAQTRQRILDAAAALYQERGVTQTTMQEVARRADVARGTVFNHFASSDALARAVIDEVFGALQLPVVDGLVGLDTVSECVARLAHDLSAFYERSESWYGVYTREPQGVPAWADVEVAYFDQLERLIRSALGPLAEDQSAVAAVSAMVGAGVYSTLRGRGLSASDAAALVVDVLSPWLERKVAFR